MLSTLVYISCKKEYISTIRKSEGQLISFLKRIFSRQQKAEPKVENKPQTKEFKFLILDDDECPPKNMWYRRSHWQDFYFLRMDTEWTKDWINYSTEERVVGVSKEDRAHKFLVLGDEPDFKIYLEREPTNTYDKNAIKVMGTATIDGTQITEQLGYLPKETAAWLKDLKELDARPYSVYLPCEDRSYGLRIRMLIRSAPRKKKEAKKDE